MKIETNHYAYQNGKDYCEYTLTNDNGMVVKLLNYGATLKQILLPNKDGQLENVILSLPTALDYSKERNFLGGTVGRVNLGKHTLELPINDGNNHIHGGSGIDTMVWNTSKLRVEEDAEFVQVTFSLIDFDGHNNYPGNLKIEVTYTLDNDNCLDYNIFAFSDQLTIFNPTNHVYFRLDGPNSDVKDLQMQIDADYYLPLDNESLPYLGMKKVTNTIFDMRKPTRLGDILDSKEPEIRREHGLNHPFILNSQRSCAKIISPKTGRKLTMTTDAPSVVVYTANHFNHTGVAKNIGRYDGVTLEAQNPPVSGDDLNASLLVANDSFIRSISWTFDF
ncbi:aldose epimerase family protein [uncultured Lactobacillus sp.]|uniref:aldose epimerase family protein n=1 Tax=uncultured Lactobacillus sp. TaxID=153152 RepID=UPI0026399D3B|nr:aldose epimerase family protein [uncultured Lactobacillus sp.]